MRKSTKLLKRFAALFLVVLMGIESFAAAVSDNDGSAFITNELSEEMIQFNFSNVKNRQGCDTF